MMAKKHLEHVKACIIKHCSPREQNGECKARELFRGGLEKVAMQKRKEMQLTSDAEGASWVRARCNRDFGLNAKALAFGGYDGKQKPSPIPTERNERPH
jgi:hypothetical protein